MCEYCDDKERCKADKNLKAITSAISELKENVKDNANNISDLSDRISKLEEPQIDPTLSQSSTNAIQNQAVAKAVLELSVEISHVADGIGDAESTANEAQNAANNAESIANNAEQLANEASANAQQALDAVSQFDPANFATAKHTHTTDEVSGLEERLFDLELGSAIEELLVARQLIKIEMDTNTLEITTPDGEFEALRDVMFNILETEDSPDFNQFYQLFNGKQLLPYMEINVPDPDLGVTHYVRLLPWTIYLYNNILTDGTSPTSATPVLEISFSHDTIQLLKDLSISERLNLSGEIYGLYFDKEDRVLKYAVR